MLGDKGVKVIPGDNEELYHVQFYRIKSFCRSLLMLRGSHPNSEYRAFLDEFFRDL